jgi:hypothetical protein
MEVEQSACISTGAGTVTVRELGGPDASGELASRRPDRVEGFVRDQPDPLSVMVRELIVSRDLDVDALAIPTDEANVEIGFGIKDGDPNGPATPELPCALSFHASSIELKVAAAHRVNATAWPATIGALGDAAALVAGTRTAP